MVSDYNWIYWCNIILGSSHSHVPVSHNGYPTHMILVYHREARFNELQKTHPALRSILKIDGFDEGGHVRRQ